MPQSRKILLIAVVSFGVSFTLSGFLNPLLTHAYIIMDKLSVEGDLEITGTSMKLGSSTYNVGKYMVFDLNQGGSKVYDDAHLHVATDDYLFLDASQRVFVTTNLEVWGEVVANLFHGDFWGDVTGNVSGTSGGLTGRPSIVVSDFTANGIFSLPSNSLTDSMIVNTITASKYFPVTGGTFSGHLKLSNHNITNIQTVSTTNLTVTETLHLPVNSLTDAMISNTITASNYLPLSGGTMAGNINLNNHNLMSGEAITATMFTGDLTGDVVGSLSGGTVNTTGFTYPTGASSGYVLTTDANGVASWADVSSTSGPWTLNGTDLYPDDTSYNVGIGTTDPEALLELSSITPTFKMTDADGLAADLLVTLDENIVQFEGVGIGFFGTGTVDDLFVLDIEDARIGIGTTEPTAELTVVGGIDLDGSADRTVKLGDKPGSGNGNDMYILGSYAGTFMGLGSNGGDIFLQGGVPRGNGNYGNIFMAYTDGMVGIGTEDPGAKLAVAGTEDTYQLVIRAYSTQSNLSSLLVFQDYYQNILMALHTDAPENVFLGYENGINNTYDQGAWEGIYNVFIGYQSGYANTVGYDNVFIGAQTGYSNTIGDSNIALGSTSMYSNTEGYGNVAIGYSALTSNTLGGNNIAIGGALTSNTEGSSNIALGEAALQSNLTGGDNIAAGWTASYDNTTGEYNLALGKNSLYNNQTGGNNVALGYSAGFNAEGSYNVYIGSGTEGETADAYELYINSEEETATPTTSLIYGNFDTNTLTVNGNLGIGTATPQTKLEVTSVIKSTPTDAPGTCDANSEGGMYYDASMNEPCFCDATNWKQFDGGGNCT